MADKKCPECPPKGSPAWMATYGDMVTLLLCLFVILFSTAKIDGREFRLILSAFRGSLGVFEGGQTLSKGKLEEMGMNLENLPSQTRGTTLSKAMKIATEVFEPEIKAKNVEVTQDERGIIISLIGNDHFAPGSAKINPGTKKTLTKVGRLLRQLNRLVRIEGHADETAIVAAPGGESYETNWELSGIRSINVLRFLHESEDVEPEKMSAVSYGEFRPISRSRTPEGMAINRRVDIVILTASDYKRGYQDPGLPETRVPGVEFSVPNE